MTDNGTVRRALFGTVSGRPVFGMDLTIPLFRDLHFGDRGEDVTEVQRALSATPSGLFDASTQSALTRFYSAHGASVMTGDTESRAAAVAAAQSVDAARTKLSAATTAAERAAATAELKPAKVQASELAGRAGAWLPSSEWTAVPSTSRVASTAGRGAVIAAAGDPLLTLRVGRPMVNAMVDVSAKGAFPVGTAVVMSAVDLPLPIQGTVTAVGAFKGAS